MCSFLIREAVENIVVPCLECSLQSRRFLQTSAHPVLLKQGKLSAEDLIVYIIAGFALPENRRLD